MVANITQVFTGGIFLNSKIELHLKNWMGGFNYKKFWGENILFVPLACIGYMQKNTPNPLTEAGRLCYMLCCF